MVIQVSPQIQHQSSCPYCQVVLKPSSLLWAGMFICTRLSCQICGAEIIEELPIGHAENAVSQVDLVKQVAFGNCWTRELLLANLINPEQKVVNLNREIFQQRDRVIILNCIDYLYGHCLLKLLNAQRHLEDNADYGLVVLIQSFMRWLVPQGIAEIWTVDIPLRQGNLYYLSLNQTINNEINRFQAVYISEAFSHPNQFNITNFTGVSHFTWQQKETKVTFIWREDRLWCSPNLTKILSRLGLLFWALMLQNWQIKRLFRHIRRHIPHVKLSVAGLGTHTNFPSWIIDKRVNQFDIQTEYELCQFYAESNLVIGVHGSNMLLPSAHAGMVIDLMPPDRWANFAQDILYQEKDSRLAAYCYRYLPVQTSPKLLALIASTMILKWLRFSSQMSNK
ncbi:hypothetical protein ACN4EK_03500 [Pantanalinema rosaneae CENA516]|uniref:hypothetical protein n=1 Tax=Pantanalinema rosaneae TaxID=1620701 RepID=UPI003D6E81C2